MAFKIRKLTQKGKKENDNNDDKLSVNRLEQGEKDGPVSVNRALEEERAEKNLNGAKTVGVGDSNLLNAFDDEDTLKRLNENARTEDSEDEEKLNETLDSTDVEDFNLNDEELSNESGNSEMFRLSENEMIEDKRETALKGKMLPLAEELRDPKMDATPIDEKDLGLPEDSYLLKRKVSKQDLRIQNETQEKQFLGANARKIRDFAAIFDKGLSSKTDPKIDLNYEIDQNPLLKKELIAQQLLRNYKSKDEREKRNTVLIFEELKLMQDEAFKDSIDADDSLFDDEKLVEKVVSKLPKI